MRAKKARKDGTVYAEPYFFDETRSLFELAAMEKVEDADERCRPSITVPIGTLTMDELVLLAESDLGAHFLAPIAIARLQGDLGATHRKLLGTLAALDGFWTTHPYLREQLVHIVEANLGREPTDLDLRRAADLLHAL